MEALVINAEREVIGRYDSKKLAKEAHKGQTGLTFLSPKDCNEQQLAELFPERVAAAQQTTEGKSEVARNRYELPPLEGEYIVKQISTRVPEGDPRQEFIDAIASCGTFEEYLEATSKSSKFQSKNGKESSVTAKQMIRYALKRGWIDYPEGSDEAAKMADVREAYESVRKANVSAKAVKKLADASVQKTAAEEAAEIGGFTEATEEEQELQQ